MYPTHSENILLCGLQSNSLYFIKKLPLDGQDWNNRILRYESKDRELKFSLIFKNMGQISYHEEYIYDIQLYIN